MLLYARLYIDKMSLLETRVVFKAHQKVARRTHELGVEIDERIREYTRDVIITGKSMEDINHQAEKVAHYLNEQTGMTWVIEISDYKDIEI